MPMLFGTVNKQQRALGACCLAALLCFCAGPAAAKRTSYDILYVWRTDQAGINAAKTSISHILGPDVARRLRVVRSDGRFGLIYKRHGDLGSAAAVARSHARMLAAHGLQAPVPVKAQDWEAPQAAALVQAKAKGWMPPQPAAAPAMGTQPEKAAAKAMEPVAKATEPAPKTVEPAPKAVEPAAKAAEPDRHDSGPVESPQQFEARVDQYLKHLRQTGSVKADERTAWSIYDLTDKTKLAGINEDILLQTASLVKPFIALAYFHEVSLGRQQYTDAAKKHMVEMIRDSDNSAADWFMRLLGGPQAVQRLLKQNYGGMLHDLSLVEYIPRNGRTFRNKASVQDYSSFLQALWDEKLPSAAEIKRVMLLPKRNRLASGTQGVPQGTEVYDKTGTTSHLCGDMGILVALRNDGRRFPYIVIGLIQKASPTSRYFTWMRNRGDVIRHVSAMAYEEMAARHHFKDYDLVSEKSAPAAAGQDKDIAVSTAPPAARAIELLNNPLPLCPVVTGQLLLSPIN